MYCPKCQSDMEYADIQGIAVARCLQCRGFWFKGDGYLAEKAQAHIVFEACGAGHGAFFDAGEYKDFSERTLGDFFKKLF